jgi:hypothetical protein
MTLQHSIAPVEVAQTTGPAIGGLWEFEVVPLQFQRADTDARD